MNIKKIVLAMAIVAVSINSYAADLKIGVINVRTLMHSAPHVKDVEAQLEKEFSVRRDELDAVGKLVMDKQQQLQRDRAVMSEDQVKKINKEIFEAQRDFKKMEKELREDQMIRNREETEKLLKTVSTKVNEFAAKEKYDLILHRDTAPFVSDKLDITDQVIKLMQAK